MTRHSLIRRQSSALLLIDAQERLMPAIESGPAALAAMLRMVGLAQRLEVPVLASEHCADKIGKLVPELRDRLPEASILAKRHFALTAEPSAQPVLAALPEQVVIAGVEAHVCLLQAALGLIGFGHEVFVVADAIGSRRESDRLAAVKRLADAGAILVTSEMVLFEWVGHADQPAFKDLLKAIK